MKKTIFALLMMTSAFAQSNEPTGTEAAYASDSAKRNNWQVWAFTAGALLAAGIGITVVALHEGSSAH